MTIWFISDTHFGHKNIIQYSNRPFSSVEEMNEHMVNEWNALVKPNDEIYHLGDFAFMPFTDFKKLLWRLNGIKHHIRGNHDKMIDQNKKQLISSGALASSQDYRELKTSGNPMIVMFHYGQRVWNKSHHGSIHLYGHSHGSLPPHGKSVDVGVDCKEITEEYRPIHIDEVLEYMNKREFQAVDHHTQD